MAVIFAIGIMFLAAAAGLLARAYSVSRVRVAARVRGIDVYGFRPGRVEQKRATALTALHERLDRVAAHVGRSVKGKGWRAPVELRKLRGAGLYTVSPEVFHGYRVLAGFGVPALILLDSVATRSFTFVTFVLIIAVGSLFWFAPALLVGTRAQRRWDRVDKDLPELIDLLIATIEAGLGFAGSLRLVADRFSGPLGQELRLMMREESMGLSTERALNNLLDRCETPSVRAFVRAVSQGETLGVSIGTMMRNLASEIRKRRRQTAHERIQKAPVKLLFPLVFMVFPALLIVLLYPAAHEVFTQLGK